MSLQLEPTAYTTAVDVDLQSVLQVGAPNLGRLTEAWGDEKDVSLYLSRCQVDTSEALVSRVWGIIAKLRASFGKVVDFGAGDARFSRAGDYSEYIGFEIDSNRFGKRVLPPRARLLEQCAFSTPINNADLAIGNPPYVRNQDLPIGWREHAAKVIYDRVGIQPSGLANAWLYFFLLSLASTSDRGLVALIVPYEWVSRPSSKELRRLIARNKWNVSVYRLHDSAFSRVLTTSSITVVDKSKSEGAWKFFEENEHGGFDQLVSETGHAEGVLPYTKATSKDDLSARRGLSPGTQKFLTLTEPERARLGLDVGNDVVPCVTSLKALPAEIEVLDTQVFRKYFRDQGQKCWLVRTDREPGSALARYLRSVPEADRATATCNDRTLWWKFTMPSVPGVLLSSGFTGDRTKAVCNTVLARAVGSVCGIYGMARRERAHVAKHLRTLSLANRVVAHSNGLRKLEIHQINSLLEAMRPRV